MGNKDMKIDNVMEVCRLCLGNEDLISVFDDRIKIPENMIDVIQITSGVTVTADDNVSQKLCNKCLCITIKMFKFRSSSIVNDMELKAMAAGQLKASMNTSVDHLLKKYPRIKVPSSITNCNISPAVVINKNEITNWVEDYKRKRKIEKKKRKQMKAAQKLLESQKYMMDIDLENKITPHLISNNAMLPESSSVKPLESDLPCSQIVPPHAIPIVPVIDVETDENQPKPQQTIPVSALQTEEISISNHLMDTPKRKLSLSLNSSKSKKLKSDSDSVDSKDSVDSLVTLKYVTKSLLICDICNGIVHSAKGLKKHKMNHMRCNLCRKCFRSMEETKEHCDSGCSIKQIMSNLPTVHLKRCDQSEELRQQYPVAFGIESDEIIDNNVMNSLLPTQAPVNHGEMIKDSLKEEKNGIDQRSPPNSKSNATEQIEILLISDDEDEDQSPITKETSIMNETVVPTLNIDECNTSQFPTSKNKNSKPFLNKEASKKVNTIKVDNKTVELPPSNSTIKPNIEIVGDNVLDVNLDDNDISLLKNLLKKTKHNIRETSIQTDMPCNAHISPSLNKDKLFELRNLREFLNFYKIPVNISYASQYSVRYGNDPSPLLKKDRSWSKVNTKVPNPIAKDICRETPKSVENKQSSPLLTSNKSTPVSISSGVSTPTALPQLLLANVQNGIISNIVTSIVPTSLINTPSSSTQNISNVMSSIVPTSLTNTSSSSTHIKFNAKGASVPLKISNSAYKETYLRTPTLPPSNSPLVLNYNLQNGNYPNTVPNKSSLTQTFPFQVPQKNYTLVNNNMNNIFNVVPSTSGQYNMPTHSVNNNLASSSFNGIGSSTRVNNIANVPIVNTMPPPSSTFIPHRSSVLKSNINSMTSSCAPPQSKIVSHNASIPVSNLTCNASSTFVPMIRVRNVSELR